MPRIDINKIYMNIAYDFASLSYANRRKVGAIIVKNEKIISVGYNGMPKGFDNNCESNNLKLTNKEVLHAESNAITKVAKSTISSDKSTMYCTTSPCVECSKLIIQSGIISVYYSEEYRDLAGIELLRKANITIEQIKI